MDFPQGRFPPVNTITPFHLDAGGYRLRVSTSDYGLDTLITSAVVANQAYYYPFQLYEPATVYKMSVIGGTSTSGNFDLGIYDSEKNRLINTGSTAMPAAATISVVDITDTALLPGLYFLAAAFSASTNVFGVAITDELALAPFPAYEEAVGSFGLPATAAFALSTTASPPILAIAVHFNPNV